MNSILHYPLLEVYIAQREPLTITAISSIYMSQGIPQSV